MKIQMTENASHMTAAVQRVTLLLRGKNAEHFLVKVRYSALQRRHLSPPYLAGQNQLLTFSCEISFNSTSDKIGGLFDLYRFIFTRYTTIPTRYTSSSYSTGGHNSRSRAVTPGLSAK